MTESSAHTLCKNERICSHKLTDKLFEGGNSFSMSSFPLRIVCMPIEHNESTSTVQILVSVGKRHFKRAVKRNRVKRQIREAYRKNKDILLKSLTEREDKNLALAFIWLADKLYPSAEIDSKVESLLHRVSEKL